MTKREFLDNLQSSISNLPKGDVIKYVDYYSEMIDDRIEDGESEEDAVNAMGNYKIIADQILKENGIVSPVKENNKNGDALKTTLIAVGSPLWIALVVVGLAVAIALIVSVYAVLISLWACVLAFAVGSFVGVILGVIALISYGLGAGLSLIGVSIMLLGLAILFYIGSKYLTKYAIYLTKKFITFTKNKCKKGA